MSLYISYDLADFDYLKLFLQQLQESFALFWMDDRSRGNNYSQVWANVLLERIKVAETAIFLVSKNVVESVYCNWEIQASIAERKNIILVLLESEFSDRSGEKGAKEKTIFEEVLTSINTETRSYSERDTYDSKVTTGNISGTGNKITGIEQVFNGAPVWVVGLTAVGGIGVSGIVLVETIKNATEFYEMVFKNVIKVIEEIGNTFSKQSVRVTDEDEGLDQENEEVEEDETDEDEEDQGEEDTDMSEDAELDEDFGLEF